MPPGAGVVYGFDSAKLKLRLAADCSALVRASLVAAPRAAVSSFCGGVAKLRVGRYAAGWVGRDQVILHFWARSRLDTVTVGVKLQVWFWRCRRSCWSRAAAGVRFMLLSATPKLLMPVTTSACLAVNAGRAAVYPRW